MATTHVLRGTSMEGGTALRRALSRIIATHDEPAAVPLRLALGLMLLPHGLQKALGLFGGPGFAGTMSLFTDTMGIPWVLALAAVLTESLGALALIAGFATRVAALAVGIHMAVAVFLVHLPNGFFMNWYGNQKGEGFEFHLLAIGIAVALVIVGGGALSIDRALTAGDRRT